MANYYDKIQYLYPDIQRVAYWFTQYDGTPWDDCYDGIVWENTDIAKPTKAELDALDDATVDAELAARTEQKRKTARDAKYQNDVYMIAKYEDYKLTQANATFSDYLDYLENLPV